MLAWLLNDSKVDTMPFLFVYVYKKRFTKIKLGLKHTAECCDIIKYSWSAGEAQIHALKSPEQEKKGPEQEKKGPKLPQ